MASRDADAGRYQRHRPEQTLLYRIVDEYYPAFTTNLTEQGRELPGYVQLEFEDYLKYGRLEHDFLRVRCESCHAEHLVAFSCKRRGICPSCGARRMAESAALPRIWSRKQAIRTPRPGRVQLPSSSDLARR
jgi:ribosomal protein S27E